MGKFAADRNKFITSFLNPVSRASSSIEYLGFQELDGNLLTLVPQENRLFLYGAFPLLKADSLGKFYIKNPKRLLDIIKLINEDVMGFLVKDNQLKHKSGNHSFTFNLIDTKIAENHYASQLTPEKVQEMNFEPVCSLDKDVFKKIKSAVSTFKDPEVLIRFTSAEGKLKCCIGSGGETFDLQFDVEMPDDFEDATFDSIVFNQILVSGNVDVFYEKKGLVCFVPTGDVYGDTDLKYILVKKRV